MATVHGEADHSGTDYHSLCVSFLQLTNFHKASDLRKQKCILLWVWRECGEHYLEVRGELSLGCSQRTGRARPSAEGRIWSSGPAPTPSSPHTGGQGIPLCGYINSVFKTSSFKSAVFAWLLPVCQIFPCLLFRKMHMISFGAHLDNPG